MAAKAFENINDFIHEVQKERGLVALFLRSAGDASSDDMEAQFAVVDRQAELLDGLPKKNSPRIEPFLNTVRYLPSKRKYAIARMLNPAEALAFYTRDIVNPAIEIVQELAVLDPANYPAKVSAFVHFLQWKERVGLERALGTQLVSFDYRDSSDFRGRLEYIVSEQQAYERMFLALVDEEGRRAIETLRREHDVFRRIEDLNRAVMNKSGAKLAETITAAEWFRLFTIKMDLLHEVGRSFAANLAMMKSEATPPVLEATDVESGVRGYREMIQALPLFAGLDAELLKSLMKYARVVTHGKGAMIFMQGEQAARFYIILEGWVKLFKGNVEGQESILQVMPAGESLLETVIFSNAPFPVSAQAVEDVKLLSIPASIVREKLQNNKEFAINMLATVAGRSQALISQFEQLTLKTVTQRVGWFLLKLFLENGERTQNLKLPYDKALIAGYLGMKPETFSRTLQALKEQGIDIERNTVSLPDVFALCDFCDMDLAAKCSRAGTEDCPNPDCSNA
ncbi:MAG: nitrate- and nitrite sensing domain-containing protein [Alphaproteobacteria bacterium]|nr:nitrate- and nitrite sensing domain-containing protein [Alphaproteobacteria bacterium]